MWLRLACLHHAHIPTLGEEAKKKRQEAEHSHVTSQQVLEVVHVPSVHIHWQEICNTTICEGYWEMYFKWQTMFPAEMWWPRLPKGGRGGIVAFFQPCLPMGFHMPSGGLGMWRQATLQVQISTPRTWENLRPSQDSGILRTLNFSLCASSSGLSIGFLFLFPLLPSFFLYIRPPHQVALLYSWPFSSWVLSLLMLLPVLIVVGRLSRNKIFLVLPVGSWTLNLLLQPEVWPSKTWNCLLTAKLPSTEVKNYITSNKRIYDM